MHYCPLKDAMALNRKEYQGLYNVYFLSLLTQFKIRVLFYWIHFPLRNIHIFILLTLSDQGCSLKGSWCVVLDNIFLCSCNALKAKYTRGLVTSFIPNMIFFPTDSFKEKKEEKKQVLLLFPIVFCCSKCETDFELSVSAFSPVFSHDLLTSSKRRHVKETIMISTHPYPHPGASVHPAPPHV